MVWALSLIVQMTANAHRLDLPLLDHSPLCMCLVQLLQLLCLKLIASLSIGMVGMILTVACFCNVCTALWLLQRPH